MTASTEWREVVADDEVARFDALAEQLRDLHARRAGGAPARALHTVGHAGVEATLTVLPALPEPARHGLFAAPATYRAIVRFSNGAGRRQHDGVPDVRGIAVKVLGVPGKKVIPGLEDATTQDFLVIQTASTPFRTPDEFVALVRAAAGSQLLLVPRFARTVGLGRALRIVRQMLGALRIPFRSFAGRAMFSAATIRCGPYAARYALLPSGDVPPAPPAKRVVLADELAERLRQGPLHYHLALQFFVDEARTPIEDASVEWKESDAPFVRVARLEIPRQDLSTPRARRLSELVETLSFDPWHALVEHRPLGALMRARNHAYRVSTQARRAAPEPSPTVLDDLDGPAP